MKRGNLDTRNWIPRLSQISGLAHKTRTDFGPQDQTPTMNAHITSHKKKEEKPALQLVPAKAFLSFIAHIARNLEDQHHNFGFHAIEQ